MANECTRTGDQRSQGAPRSIADDGPYRTALSTILGSCIAPELGSPHIGISQNGSVPPIASVYGVWRVPLGMKAQAGMMEQIVVNKS